MCAIQPGYQLTHDGRLHAFFSSTELPATPCSDAYVLPFLPAPFCPAELPGEEEAEEARRLYALVLQQLGELRRTTLQVAAQF